MLTRYSGSIKTRVPCSFKCGDLRIQDTRNLAGNPDSPQAVVFLTSIIDATVIITCTTVPYKTGIRLLDVAQNPADGFPARLLVRRRMDHGHPINLMEGTA